MTLFVAQIDKVEVRRSKMRAWRAEVRRAEAIDWVAHRRPRFANATSRPIHLNYEHLVNDTPSNLAPQTAIVALGGNLGDVPQTFQRAVELMSRFSRSEVRISRLYRSAPMGADAGSTFFNAAVAFDSDLAPESLLDQLQGIETQLGRVRTIHWGPRTLDLDLIAYGSHVLTTERLTLPHPHCWYRRFVLDPVCDIAGANRHSVLNATFNELRQRLLARPLRIAIDLCHFPAVTVARLKSEFPSVVFVPLSAENDSAIVIPLDQLTSSHSLFNVISTDRERFEQFIRDVLTAATDELLPNSSQ